MLCWYWHALDEELHYRWILWGDVSNKEYLVHQLLLKGHAATAIGQKEADNEIEPFKYVSAIKQSHKYMYRSKYPSLHVIKNQTTWNISFDILEKFKSKKYINCWTYRISPNVRQNTCLDTGTFPKTLGWMARTSQFSRSTCLNHRTVQKTFIDCDGTNIRQNVSTKVQWLKKQNNKYISTCSG